MQRKWKLHEAKNRLSALVEAALRDGPQVVTRNGTDTVVVVAADRFRQLCGKKGSLVNFFESSPLKGVELDLERDRNGVREVEL